MRDRFHAESLLPPTGTSPWHHIAATQEEDDTGLLPWWGDASATIHRTVYAPTLSRVRPDFERLLAAQALYRLALGQPDQEELVRALERRLENADDASALREWLEEAALDLCPYDSAP